MRLSGNRYKRQASRSKASGIVGAAARSHLPNAAILPKKIVNFVRGNVERKVPDVDDPAGWVGEGAARQNSVQAHLRRWVLLCCSACDICRPWQSGRFSKIGRRHGKATASRVTANAANSSQCCSAGGAWCTCHTASHALYAGVLKDRMSVSHTTNDHAPYASRTHRLTSGESLWLRCRAAAICACLRPLLCSYICRHVNL